MKKFIVLIIASIFGSALTIGTTKLMDLENSKHFEIEHITSTPVIGAAYSVNSEGKIVPLDFVDVAKKVMSAVVHIKSTRVQQLNAGYQRHQDSFNELFEDDIFKHFFGPQQRSGTPRSGRNKPQAVIAAGSGVIINSNGYIVTNNHVIENASDIEVALEDNRIFKAKVIGTDPSTDIALLQIKETGLPYVPFVNSDKVEVGEWVLAVGNPFNLNSTVTAGIVSAKGRNINILHRKNAIESFIQTDAAINPGNSGGALINLQGGLVGINTAIASPTGSYAGYGFAIPVNIVSKVVEDLMKYGFVQRGYLGLMIRSIDGNLAKEKDINLTEGVYVDSILLNSAAVDAGIRTGDVIIEVDGIAVKTSSNLLELIGGHRPGDKVHLKVNRKGKELEKLVTLRNQKGEAQLSKKESIEVFELLGIELEEVSKPSAKKMNIDGGLRITKLLPGKLIRSTNVKEGFIITKVNGKKVTTIKEFEKLLQNNKGGIMIEGIYKDYPGIYYYAFGL
ncbi:MAG: serine protease [Bacteroidetes bacterium]|nr:MAG: serine protease [Bacteroidota bacterium]RLD86188.1 MAG: serine protease [Bacteroidota bacterium]